MIAAAYSFIGSIFLLVGAFGLATLAADLVVLAPAAHSILVAAGLVCCGLGWALIRSGHLRRERHLTLLLEHNK